MSIQITVENCGRFFDDFVVTDGERLLQIESSARKIQLNTLRRWLKTLTRQSKISPKNAQGLVHVGSELGNAATVAECNGILERGRISQKQARALARTMLRELKP